jgi:hypothetical protein
LLAVIVTVFLSVLSVQVATSAANAGQAADNTAAAPIHFIMKTPSLADIGTLCRGGEETGSKFSSCHGRA